jgi:hypothetical protein
LTDHAVITSTGELLAAVAHLSDDELLLLSKLAWRLANDFTEESTRPRVAEVVHRCGVVLAEEHDRRRALVEHARQQLDPDGRLGCLLRNGHDPDLENPSTD